MLANFTLTSNMFCPTGEGGGVDPSCGSGGTEDAKLRAAALKVLKSKAPASVHRKLTAASRVFSPEALEEIASKLSSVQMHDVIPTSEGEPVDPLGVVDHSTMVLSLSKDAKADSIAHEMAHVLDHHDAWATSDHGKYSGDSRFLAALKADGQYWGSRLRMPDLKDDPVEAFAVAVNSAHTMTSANGTRFRQGSLKDFAPTVFHSLVAMKVLSAEYAAKETAAAPTRNQLAANAGSKLLRTDPTRSRLQRRAMEKELRRRFRKLKGRLLQLAVQDNAFALNASFEFRSDPEKVRAFQDWLRSQYREVGLSDERLWQKYIEDGYRKGAGRTYDDARPKLSEELAAFYSGGKQEFLRTSFARPESTEKVQLLAGRAFDELQGVTDAMSTRMSRVLTDGLVKGESPLAVGKRLAKEVDLAEGRAEAVARTEFVRAHAEGQLDAMASLGIADVSAAVEWSTAEDGSVCPLCEPLEGVVLSVDEARGLIPRHPNCRCAWVPAVLESEGQKRSEGDVEGALEASGLDVDLDAKRPQLNAAMDRLSLHMFCPTGPGGGVDPTCGRSERLAGSEMDAAYPARTTLPRATEAEWEAVKLLRKEQHPEAKSAEEFPLEQVPLASIKATQGGIEPDALPAYRNWIREHGSMVGSPMGEAGAIEYGGTRYISDGHHRVEAYKAEGHTSIPMHVEHLS